SGASGLLAAGDRIVAIDGRRVSSKRPVTTLLRNHRCAGATVDGCAAATPARVTVVRAGHTRTFAVTPHYSSANKRMLLGVVLGYPIVAHYGFFAAIGGSAAAMWDTAASTG